MGFTEDYRQQKQNAENLMIEKFKEVALEALSIAERTGRRVDIKFYNDCADSSEIIFYERGEEAK